MVVKRPRALLDVDTHWPADTRRILDEAATMRRFPDLAPTVVDLDVENLVLVMTFHAGESWKDQLLRGIVDPRVVRKVAASLRAVHDAPLDGLDGESRFNELRLTPYFGNLPAVLPQVSQELGDVVARLRRTRTHLIHGDYSPKNLLVRATPGAAEITILDWEVACAGDPAFDVAFLMAHLLAKSAHLPTHRTAFETALRDVLDEYGPVDRDWLARLLGAMLLARVDGVSRLTYLDERAREEIRGRGVSLIRGQESLTW